jgi:hypothetical protein
VYMRTAHDVALSRFWASCTHLDPTLLLLVALPRVIDSFDL